VGDVESRLAVQGIADSRRTQAPTKPVILLDTNAIIWLERGHARTRELVRRGDQLYVSPASLLELQFLRELGRIRINAPLADLVRDRGWLLDDPPAAAWFERAEDIGWTHDPFDRLLVAHARLRRWRLVTADTRLLGRLSERERIEI